MRWARAWLIGILLASALCLTSCATVRYVYKPIDEQIFLVPKGTELKAWASGTLITTDGVDGKVELPTLTLPYDGIILSEGYFLKIFREASDGMDNGK